MKNKSGQAWGFDLLVACSIFFMAIFIFYFFAINSSPESETKLETLSYEADIISNSLLSEGYPSEWDIANVQEIGLLSQGKINNTKLEAFYNLSVQDYNLTKIIFGVSNNYFINFSEAIYIEESLVNGIGMSPTVSENLIKSTRYAIYNNKPVMLNIEVWN